MSRAVSRLGFRVECPPHSSPGGWSRAEAHTFCIHMLCYRLVSSPAECLSRTTTQQQKVLLECWMSPCWSTWNTFWILISIYWIVFSKKLKESCLISGRPCANPFRLLFLTSCNHGIWQGMKDIGLHPQLLCLTCLAEQVVQAEPEKALEAAKQAATNPEPRAPVPPEGEIIAEASEAGTLSQKGAATAIDETKQSATGTSRHCAWGIWRKDPASTQDFILIQIA